jgi:hypothetical protein
MNRLRFLLTLCLGIVPAAFSAETFGPISVTPMSLASGETHHGYREFRIILENRSPKDSHDVTLIYPERSFNFGNSIGRISRRVSLAPGTSAAVPIWQPPLPQGGSGRMRVLIDGQEEGLVTVPTYGHMSQSGGHHGGSMVPATVLVSRSINFDDLSRGLRGDNNAFSATMATGSPGSRGIRGVVPTAWSPDTSASGLHWLELDYDKPMQVDRLRLYDTMGASYSGEIILTGVSGTNLPTIPFSNAGLMRPGTAREISFPLTAEPIKSVRLNLGSIYAGMISVDAVELQGAGGSIWAAAARASSELGAGSSYPGTPGSTGREVNRLLRSEVPVSEWSEMWLSYSAFDGVAISGRDLQGMPAAVKTALWRYTECGGNLIVLGETTAPEPWQSAAKENLEGGQLIDAGFGRCFVFRAERAPEIPATALKRLSDTLADCSRKWQSLPDENSANAGFPVVENVRIPVRGIVVIMLGFVIVIGPVNIILLSRMQRRTWLLWTIPAISFVTSLVVFAYSMFREGVTPDVRIEGLTHLDQSNHRAATVGMTAFYCPLTPGDGLFFSSDTEATPLVESWTYGRGSTREMSWTQGQHLERGWVTARVPAHFRIRKSETRRERIQLEGTGAQLAVVNGLGAPIHSLWLADGAGRIFTATNVAAGQKVKLTLSSQNPQLWRSAGSVQALADKIGFNQLGDYAFTNAFEYLSPDSYIAELEGNPFLENGLGARSKSARTKARSVVYGLLETTSKP